MYSFFLPICALALFSRISSYTFVDELDLTKYDGVWFEVYDDLFDQTFQRGGRCVTAEYTLENNGTVSIINSEILPSGKAENITGYAFYEDDNSGGELSVYLEGTPSVAPYWVVELGPVLDDEYQYSIVSDPQKLSLFVLARDVEQFMKQYENEVLETLSVLGFDKTRNSPLKVNQSYCEYETI